MVVKQLGPELYYGTDRETGRAIELLIGYDPSTDLFESTACFTDCDPRESI